MAKGNPKKTRIIIASVLTPILIIAWVILAYYSLNAINADDRVIPYQTKYIAHRGYSAKYMENTSMAFKSASMEPFFSGIETDVWRTKDGVFVCSHDVNPFVDKKIKITEKNFDEISSLPLDTSKIQYKIDLTKEYRICTLREYLSICLVSNKLAIIEIKQDFDAAQTEELLMFVKGKISYDKVFFAGFNKQIIERIHTMAPYYKILVFSYKEQTAYLHAELGYNVGTSQSELTDSIIKKAHKNSSYVFVYTIKDTRTATKFKNMEVDFIICDDVIA